MSKPDFHFSNYVEVPDAWIENALNIPNTAQSTPVASPLPRRMIAAASIVLVTVLGITVYFLFRNKESIPVAQKTAVSATETQPESTMIGTESTEVSTSPDHAASEQSRQNLSSVPTQPATQTATDSRGRIIIIPGSTTIVHYPAQTEAPAATSPATDPQQRDATDATRPAPTQTPVTPAPPSPTQPKAAPTSSPATPAPVTVSPTEEQKKTGIIRMPSSAIEITVAADEETRLYCRVYDSQGRILGDSNLYAPSHLVDISLIPSAEDQYESAEYSYTFEYLPSQVCGTLKYQLYTQGDHVVYTGTVTI